MEVIQRPIPGIPEAMRAESMKITPKGCLSRSVAGIRARTLIITLPGSQKASAENILAVIDPVAHGLDMLYSEGSADCAKMKGNPISKQEMGFFIHRNGYMKFRTFFRISRISKALFP